MPSALASTSELSVISRITSAGTSPWRRSCVCSSSSSPGSCSRHGDRLIARVRRKPDCFQVASRAIAWSATLAVSAWIRPSRSARAMKRSGAICPFCGCRQRASASTPLTWPLRMSTLGWYATSMSPRRSASCSIAASVVPPRLASLRTAGAGCGCACKAAPSSAARSGFSRPASIRRPLARPTCSTDSISAAPRCEATTIGTRTLQRASASSNCTPSMPGISRSTISSPGAGPWITRASAAWPSGRPSTATAPSRRHRASACSRWTWLSSTIRTVPNWPSVAISWASGMRIPSLDKGGTRRAAPRMKLRRRCLPRPRTGCRPWRRTPGWTALRRHRAGSRSARRPCPCRG